MQAADFNYPADRIEIGVAVNYSINPAVHH